VMNAPQADPFAGDPPPSFDDLHAQITQAVLAAAQQRGDPRLAQAQQQQGGAPQEMSMEPSDGDGPDMPLPSPEELAQARTAPRAFRDWLRAGPTPGEEELAADLHAAYEQLGDPGAGYLYVRPDLAPTLKPGIVEWAAHATPFEFSTGAIDYADAPARFQSGTPNVPSLYSARGGYEIVGEIGVEAIREKSLRLTRRLIDLAQAAGHRVNTPTDDRERAGAVIVDVPNGAAVTEELIRRDVIVDYRPGAGIRIAPHSRRSRASTDLRIARCLANAFTYGQPSVRASGSSRRCGPI